MTGGCTEEALRGACGWREGGVGGENFIFWEKISRQSYIIWKCPDEVLHLYSFYLSSYGLKCKPYSVYFLSCMTFPACEAHDSTVKIVGDILKKNPVGRRRRRVGKKLGEVRGSLSI